MNSALRTISLTLTGLALLLTCGCGSAPSPVETAESFVQAVHQGDYAKAADMTLALDSAPNYKDLIALRYKDLGMERQEQHGGIKSIVCKRSDVSDNEADVYLAIEYSDNTTANILIQLSKDGEDWKIR